MDAMPLFKIVALDDGRLFILNSEPVKPGDLVVNTRDGRYGTCEYLTDHGVKVFCTCGLCSEEELTYPYDSVLRAHPFRPQCN